MWFESMHESWQAVLAEQRSLLENLESSLTQLGDITPPLNQVMRAFRLPLGEVRALIIGQDPYPERGVACGLAFAVADSNAKLPASLRNIMKELGSDLPQCINSGDVIRWQHQGVLLLNRHLTTQVANAGGHSKIGWTTFTAAVVQALAVHRVGRMVAILWGSHAAEVRPLLGDVPSIVGVHPSPLSAYRGFFGSKPFSECNRLLGQMGEPPIDWNC